jgi:hypothetical protein
MELMVDALRITTQWSDQLWYLQRYVSSSSTDDRHRKFPWGLSHLFLIINVLAMLSCSFGVISKKYPDYSVFGLLGVVVAQGQSPPYCIRMKAHDRSRLRTLVRSIILPPKLECSRWITHGPLRLSTEQEEIVRRYSISK